MTISEKMRKKMQSDLKNLNADEMKKIVRLFEQEDKKRKKKKSSSSKK